MEINEVHKIEPSWWKDFASPALFQSGVYLEQFVRHFRPDPVVYRVSDSGLPVAVLPFERHGEGLILLGMSKVLGKEEVTDYGDILVKDLDDVGYGKMWNAVFDLAKKEGMAGIALDYVRQDSRLYKYFHSQGAASQKVEVAPFITLPSSWDGYLASLERTDRKELKRKMKRIDTVPHSFEIHGACEDPALNDFIRLHRLSDRSKEKFMSDKMEAFFRDLACGQYGSLGAKIALLKIDEKAAAAVFFFEDKNGAYLYNSGFDPAFGRYSAGLMVHAFLIRRNIDAGLKLHDFLRGGERYKYDLGATDMPLYRITKSL